MTAVIKPIRTEDDYDWALAEVEAYFLHEPPPGSQDDARFQLLLDLIDRYEERHWKIAPPSDPIAVIEYVMAEKGLSQTDLAEALGSRSRASELLNRTRALSLDMVRKLSSAFGIPADLLIADMSAQIRKAANTNVPVGHRLAREGRVPAKAAAAKRAPARKAAAKKKPAKKAASKNAPARKSAAKKPAAKAVAVKVPAHKASAKKPARKQGAKKAGTRRIGLPRKGAGGKPARKHA